MVFNVAALLIGELSCKRFAYQCIPCLLVGMTALNMCIFVEEYSRCEGRITNIQGPSLIEERVVSGETVSVLNFDDKELILTSGNWEPEEVVFLRVHRTVRHYFWMIPVTHRYIKCTPFMIDPDDVKSSLSTVLYW